MSAVQPIGVRLRFERLRPPAAARPVPARPAAMKIVPTLLLSLLAIVAVAPAQVPAPVGAPREGGQGPGQDGVTEGFGRGPSYRTALGDALEDAVARVNGIEVRRGSALRSRIAVVTEHTDGAQPGWFDGEGEREHAWVQQQIAGFVLGYEVVKKEQGADRTWEVTVRARVAGPDRTDAAIVVQLVDNDLRKWQLERYEEGGAGKPFARQGGEFEGPRIAEYLRNSGAIEIAGDGPGVTVGADAAPGERGKAGQQLVPSHRVLIDWQPIALQSLVERPNKARPTTGPRPEVMSSGVVAVRVRIDDLVQRVQLLDQAFSVTADAAGSYSADRLEAFVNALVDKAKATVAAKIYFALRRPVVLRKWAGDGGAWFVEVAMSRRVAAAYERFAVGNAGTLASPDWRPSGAAELVGGTGLSCTFRLDGAADPADIEPDVSEVRPVLQ